MANNSVDPASRPLRTLVISPNWIGDAVMAQPLLSALKQSHPTRRIDVVAAAWVAPVWRAVAEVDNVMETPFKHGKLQWGERRQFAKMLQQEVIIRVFSAYIDLLFKEDLLNLAKAERDLYAEQRKVNDRLFEKGEGTKTDMLETQARLDGAEALVLESLDNQTVSRETLR